MADFRLQILSADEPFYDGPCASLMVPTEEGYYGVMANHVNCIMAIDPGVLLYRETAGAPQKPVVVATGVLKVENNEVSVLVLSAERPEEIDRNRAEERAREARAALNSKQSAHEFDATKAKLARALNRIHASEMFDRINGGAK